MGKGKEVLVFCPLLQMFTGVRCALLYDIKTPELGCIATCWAGVSVKRSYLYSAIIERLDRLFVEKNLYFPLLPVSFLLQFSIGLFPFCISFLILILWKISTQFTIFFRNEVRRIWVISAWKKNLVWDRCFEISSNTKCWRTWRSTWYCCNCVPCICIPKREGKTCTPNNNNRALEKHAENERDFEQFTWITGK